MVHSFVHRLGNKYPSIFTPCLGVDIALNSGKQSWIWWAWSLPSVAFTSAEQSDSITEICLPLSSFQSQNFHYAMIWPCFLPLLSLPHALFEPQLQALNSLLFTQGAKFLLSSGPLHLPFPLIPPTLSHSSFLWAAKFSLIPRSMFLQHAKTNLKWQYNFWFTHLPWVPWVVFPKKTLSDLTNKPWNFSDLYFHI